MEAKKSKQEQSLKGEDDLVSRHREFIELVTMPDSENNSEEKLKETLKSLEKYEKMEIRDLTQNTQIIFQEEHICNDNLKIRGEDEGFFKPEEIIEQNEKTMVTLKECEKVSIVLSWVTIENIMT